MKDIGLGLVQKMTHCQRCIIDTLTRDGYMTMEPVIEDCCVSTLKPIEHDLFTSMRKEIDGNVFTYYDCVLKVPIGPVRAGCVAEKVVIRMDIGSINVLTESISFYGYVKLAVV